MKKLIAFLLALILVFGFAACSENEELPQEENVSEPVPESSHQSEENPEQSEENSEPVPEEEPKIKPLPEINGEPLSEEEIDFFNDLFYPMLTDEETGEFKTNPWSHFFMSYYDEVWEINFPMFVYYFPGEGRDVDEKEFQKLCEVEAWRFDNCKTLEEMPVPVHAVSKKEVDAVLEEYTGIITSDDLDTSAVAYLEEYDCYYTSTSDYGPGMFICSGGERIGNTIYLYEEDGLVLYEELGKGTDMLVLIEEEGSYKIVSHQHYKNP